MRRVAKKILSKSAWDKDLVELDAPITSAETALLRSEVAKAIENPYAGVQLHLRSGGKEYTAHAVDRFRIQGSGKVLIPLN